MTETRAQSRHFLRAAFHLHRNNGRNASSDRKSRDLRIEPNHSPNRVRQKRL